MTIIQSRLIRMGSSLALVALLAGCGGGDDEEDEDDFDNDVDITGYWTGTLRPDGGASGTALLLVGADGKFVIESAKAFMIGTGSTSGNSFTAGATGYAAPGMTFANGSYTAAFTLNGTASAQSSISGSYSSLLGMESGTVTFSYNSTISNRTASLPAVSGNYTVFTPPGAPAASLVINPNGSMTLNVATGCTGTGSVQVTDAAHNYYSWTLTLAGCTANGNFSGIATMLSTTQVKLWGQSTNAPFVLNATK